LRQIFDKWDTDHNGYITPNELQKAMHHLGEPVSDEDIRLIMTMFDKEHTGRIDFAEFGQLYNYVSELKQEFTKADTSRTGSLDMDQVKSAMHRHHKALMLAGGVATVYSLFKLHDLHKKGKLEWPHFLRLGLHMGALRSNYESSGAQQQLLGLPQSGGFGQQSYGQQQSYGGHQKLFENFANWASGMIDSHIRR